jgi:lambda repressor-like predicted transcriptional regulator
MNPLRRLLFGPGRLPEDLAAALHTEGLTILVEEVPGSVTYRNLKTPGRRANWKREPMTAAIALSTKRFVITARRYKHIDVPVAELARYNIHAANPKPDQLLVEYDLSTTHPTWLGQVELRLKTNEAARITRTLTQLQQ